MHACTYMTPSSPDSATGLLWVESTEVDVKLYAALSKRWIMKTEEMEMNSQ
jgi:hypothetical protein